MINNFRNRYTKLLETIVIWLMIILTVIVVVAVVFRKMGASLSWYDEVASVLLAWLSYYGAALALMHREHIGVNGLVNAMKPSLRVPIFILTEALVISFFVLLGVVGFQVLQVLEGDSLTSLTWVPTSLTQSVIPISGAFFVIAELLCLPEQWRMAKSAHGFTAHDAVELPDQDANAFDKIKEEFSK